MKSFKDLTFLKQVGYVCYLKSLYIQQDWLPSFLFCSGYSEVSRSQVFSIPHMQLVRLEWEPQRPATSCWPIIFVVKWSQDSLGLHSQSQHHLSPSMALTWIIEQPQDASKFFLWCLQDAGIRNSQFSDFSSPLSFLNGHRCTRMSAVLDTALFLDAEL